MLCTTCPRLPRQLGIFLTYTNISSNNPLMTTHPFPLCETYLPSSCPADFLKPIPSCVTPDSHLV